MIRLLPLLFSNISFLSAFALSIRPLVAEDSDGLSVTQINVN